MKSNSRVLRGWRDFGVKATAIILTILLATQMVGTPAFASGALTNKQASEDIATTVDDTGVEPSGTEATDTTVPDEAAGAPNEPAPADSTQATEEPVVETVESATEPATETPAADPAANTVLGAEPEPAPAPAPAVEQDQLASIKLNLADGASITLSKDGNKIDDDTNPVDVPVNEELKFTAQAAEGWQIDKVKTVIDGVETELTADANGEYAVAAENVTDALTVKVESSEVATADDAAEAIDETEAIEEEPTVVEAEEVVADVSSPAFEGYAYVDDVVVKVTAGEGVLPEGTAVEAYRVDRQDVVEAVAAAIEQQGLIVESTLAIDVTLYDRDGEAIQPDGAVNVCFFNTGITGSEIDVYRVSDDASTVEAVSSRQADPDIQSFDVDHFTIYVVGGGSSDSVETRSISGSSAVLVGQTITLSSDEGDFWNNWTVDDNNLASITSNGKTAELTGKADGTVTVEHEYKNGRYSRQQTERFTVKVVDDEAVVIFDANGGSGGDVSWSVEPAFDGDAVSYAVSLPTPSAIGMSNGNKIFAGWSTQKDGKGDNYVAGIEYPLSVPQTTLYAIWLDGSQTADNNIAYFYIRSDGEIQFEPAGYGTDQYYPKNSAKTLQGSLRTPVAVNNNLDAVDANLKIVPDDQDIKGVLNDYEVSFDPETQYIEWYVIKYRDDGGQDYTSAWNVDGVIRDKNKYEVSYNPNGGSTAVPGSNEFAAGATVQVLFNPTPTKVGFEFLGWSEDQNATTATYTRQGSATSFTMPDRDVVLYAVWQEKGKVTYKYEASPEAGGSVSLATESVNPATGNAKGSTATAKAGYSFDGWYSGATKITSDNAESSGVKLSDDGATLIPQKNSDGVYAGGTYTAKFAENEDVTYTYTALTGGTVSPDYETIAPATGTAQGSTASAAAGYTFVGWYSSEECDEGSLVSEDAAYVPQKTDGAYTGGQFWAKFAADFSAFSITGGGELWTYDASTQYIDVNGVYPGDALTYDLGNGEVVKATVNAEGVIEGAPGFKNAEDSATVTVAVTRGGASASAEAVMTIKERPVTASGSVSKVYDGSTALLEDVALTSGAVDGDDKSGVVGDDDVAVVSIAAEAASYAKAEKHENLSLITENEGGLLALTGLSGDDAANYKLVSVTATGTITAQSITPGPDPDPDPSYGGIKVQGPDPQVYDAADQTPGVVVTDKNGKVLEEGTDYRITGYDNNYNVTTEGSPAIIHVEGMGNYGGSIDVEFEIIPAPLTVTTPSAGKVYDGSALTAGPADVEGLQGSDATAVTITANGTQTDVGNSVNGVSYDWGQVLASNYSITEDLGTLTVWPQSIDPTDPGENPDPDDPDAPDPSDPDPDFPGEDPDPDNPVVPDQPFYTGAEVDYPQDVSYNGADQTWAPTVTDAEGNLLTAGEDYEVSYSTDDRTNVTGDITVTITGKGNYAGAITREYQITPLAIDVYIENQTKVEGEGDPTFTFNYEGVLEGESMGWTGAFVRDAGEAAGTYNVAQGGFVLADNEAGNFLASNYTLTVHPGTLTITAAPVPPGPDDPDPVTPVTPLPTPDPTPVPTPTPGDPGATETTTTPATEEATETIEDDATPRTAPEPIDDDATPLAANEHRDCWVHWLMLLGILVTVVYYGGVGVRRVRFSSSLQSFEDDVLGNDETNR